MQTITILKNEEQNLIKDLKTIHKELDNILFSTNLQILKYDLAHYISYDSFNVKIKHKKHQWIEFATIEIGFDEDINFVNFDYSHSSGGFNKEVSVDDRLNTTIEIFEFIKDFKENQNQIKSILKQISNIRILETKLYKVKNELKIIKKEDITKKFEAELIEKKYEKIDNVLKFVKEFKENQNSISSETILYSIQYSKFYKKCSLISYYLTYNSNTKRFSINDKTIAKSKLIAFLTQTQFYKTI
jgi:hypothetical protein